MVLCAYIRLQKNKTEFTSERGQKSMSTFLENVIARAKADKKTIVLPESMDRRTFEAAAVVLKLFGFTKDKYSW